MIPLAQAAGPDNRISPEGNYVFAESFEDTAVLQVPPGYTGADYTFSPATGTNVFVSSTTANTGSKSLYSERITGSGGQDFAYTTALNPSLTDPCTTSQGTSPVLGFSLNISAYPSVGFLQATMTRVGSTATTLMASMKIAATTGLITVGSDDVSTTRTMPLNQWVSFGLNAYTANCNSASIAIVECLYSAELLISQCDSRATLTSTQDGTFTGITASLGVGAVQANFVSYWDDLEYDTRSPAAPATATRFCADPSVIDYDGNPATPTTSTGASDDYGYNYRRGGTFFDSATNDPGALGLSTGFEYHGSQSESTWDYAAKSFATGTKALHENITIEAGTDAAESVYRVNFHTAVGSNADDTSKGNGLTTGHFADHLEVQFQEESNTWRVGFYYVNGGARTAIGSTLAFGDANDATQFTVWLDTRATGSFSDTLTSKFGSNWYVQGGSSLSAGPFIAVSSISTAGGPSGQDVAVLAIRYLNSISGTPFTEDTVGDVWNVGYGTSSLISATTGLDENNQGGRANTGDEGGTDSTCIFDDAGTMVLSGSLGGTPESELPDAAPSPSTDPTNPFSGLTATAINGFLGMLLVGAFAASMNEKTGAGAAGLAIFAMLGLFVAYFLGYIDLWVLVLLMVLGVAAIFMGMIRGNSQGGF